MSKEFMRVYHMPFKAQEIKQDEDSTNFRLQMDQAFEEMTKSFVKQQDEMIINYLYKKYKDTKVSDVWVLSKPDFEKFLLEMLPKWKGKDLKGANYHNIIIDEEIDNANPSEVLECLNCLERLHDCGVFNYEEMEDYNTIKQALQRLESIDNSNPSEALMKLNLLLDRANHDEILSRKSIDFCEKWLKEIQEAYDTIKQALLKAQANTRSEEILQKHYQEGITLDSVRALKQERDNYKNVLEVIKKKDVDIYILTKCKTVDEYNFKIVHIVGETRELTKEEFDTVKEVLE